MDNNSHYFLTYGNTNSESENSGTERNGVGEENFEKLIAVDFTEEFDTFDTVPLNKSGSGMLESFVCLKSSFSLTSSTCHLINRIKTNLRSNQSENLPIFSI